VAVAALLIVLCGSRGGLLSFAVAGSVYVMLTKASIARKACFVAAMVLATAIVLFYTEPGRQAIEVFNGRIIELTIERQYLAGRGELWTQALQLFVERPLFGWGLDGFRANSWNYPHNIFLEVMVEGGAVGLLLFLNVFRAWRGQCRRSNLRTPSVSLVALALTVTAAQTSGDLFDSRGIFLMLALATPPRLLTTVQNRLRRLTPALASRPGMAVDGIDGQPNVF
jgi:O-antigen ligase